MSGDRERSSFSADWLDLRLRPLVSLAVVGVGIAGVGSWSFGPWMWALDGLLVLAVALLWLYAYKGRNTTEIDRAAGSVRLTYRVLGVAFYRKEIPRAEIDCVLLGWDVEVPLAGDAANGAGVNPVTLRLVSGEKWVVLQSLETQAASDLASRLEREIGIPACGEEAGGNESGRPGPERS